MNQKKEALLNSLYSICQTRSLTSKEVLTKLVIDVQVSIPSGKQDELLDIIRQYKNTGKNLEATVNSLYDIFYPKVDAFFGNKSLWEPEE